MKTCTRCEESKALDSFGRDGRTRDGLRKVCADCRSLSKSRLGVATGRETLRGTEAVREPLRDVLGTFNEMTRGLEPQGLNIPWPDDPNLDTIGEQREAIDGILIAVVQGNWKEAKFLMSQVCHTWEELLTVEALIIHALVITLCDEDKRDAINLSRDFILDRVTHC